jgi:TctA family transporter
LRRGRLVARIVDAIAAVCGSLTVHRMEADMRKMIMMAIAGYLWKKFQAKRTYSTRNLGRF